jgi:uncharacterized membrane protein
MQAQNSFQIHKTREGRLLLAAVFLSVLLAVSLWIYRGTNPEMAKVLFLVFIAHTVGGRAAGIGLCILNGLGFAPSILYNFLIEILIVFYTYSIFVLSANNVIKSRLFRLAVLRVDRKARRHKDKIASYGWWGVFVFVMVPLPFTGPVMGSVIGYLLRFKILRNFSAVFLGTLTAIVVWVLFFDFLEQHLHIIRYVFVGIIAVVGVSYFRTIREWFR